MPAARGTTRRPRQSADSTGDQLANLVSELIRENRRLKAQVAKLNVRGGESIGTATRGLNAMRRRVERALGASAPGGRGRRAPAAGKAATTRTRRPLTPEVREKRLAALAKARQVRAAKRAATQG